MNIGDTWHCKKFPTRSLRILRKFNDTSDSNGYYIIRDGWFVQGYEDGREIGTEYKIGIDALNKNWYPETGIRSWIKKTLRRLKLIN